VSYVSKRQQLEEEQEAALKKMTVAQLQEELNARLKACLIEEIKKLPRKISDQIEESAGEIICAVIGLERDKWNEGRWSIIDAHRPGAMGRVLGEHVMAQIQAAVPNFVENLLVADVKVGPSKKAYTEAYKQHLARTLNHELWQLARTNAEKCSVDILKKISEEVAQDEEKKRG
jgi:hypothetical protein